MCAGLLGGVGLLAFWYTNHLSQGLCMATACNGRHLGSVVVLGPPRPATQYFVTPFVWRFPM